MKRALVHVLAMVAPLAAICAGKQLLVGISESYPEGARPSQVAVNASYADAVAKAGHLPVVITRFGSDAQFDALVAKLDVLVMTGGEDIAPEKYREKAAPKLGKVNVKRDEFDFRLLEAARRRNLPVVGICRGCQLLNVAFGGTLYQDLPSEFPVKDVQHRNTHHRITIDSASRLAKIVGKTGVLVNSYHHQAVKDLAPGFRTVAKSPEGVVEAIECDVYPAVGVQFHPEKMLCEEGDCAFANFFVNIGQLFEKR
jgi:gamma-glutamyl-gamma-aminobutyrate hydrolase PuuD